MADNTQVTSGSGDTIRDVDRTGVKTQVVIPDISQSGGAELLGLGQSKLITATSAGLTTATTVYTSGDQLGTELTLASLVRTGVGAVIQSAVLVDAAKVIGTGVDLFLFSAATTPAADNAANAWSDADMANCLGIIHFTDFVQSANNYVALATNLPFVVKPGSGTSIFADLVTRSANAVFGAVTDLKVILGVVQD